ncbi:hypothetical protein C8A03DRAFT_18769 [Achaetomium macrosporum]|uniref:Uncharacterized protein n=1 Tax=Achaetomium macrosporum TaxID=79813 RepID=A0AAN7C2R2_9PEZI|nr:hypothetical protein C8A03DRAFT_18769 [Achaetomium macrosporum]
MAGTFFTSWELWQQMTFVLAMAIVAVFCAGLGKLWWNNRLMKKQVVLDEEKRARVEEMRKTGLPIKRANNIPFGVRAIQSGVEVDGIWISRPASLNETASVKLASSTSLTGRDSDSQKRGRDHPGDAKSVLVTTASFEDKQATSDTSISQKLTDSESTESPHSGAPPLSRSAYKAKKQSSRPAGGLNEDALRKLEGQPAGRPLYETYIPTSSSRQEPRQPSLRSSASSSGESVDSQPRSVRRTSGRSYTSSSHSSRLYRMARTAQGGRPGHDPVLRRWPEKEGRDPFATPARTPSGFSLLSRAETPGPGAQGEEVSAPERTFGPGDLHVNRSSRRVNDGFEILAGGTFGMPGGMGKSGESEQNGQALGSSTKLRKSGGWTGPAGR